MRILFVGDVVGRPGRQALADALPALRAEHRPDLIVANGENVAGGCGITPATAAALFEAGVQVVTSGNHIWDQREILPYLDSTDRLLRPANYPGSTPGKGFCLISSEHGPTVAVVNLIGRVFMGAFNDPFRTADHILEELQGQAEVIVVDFHAEATSEKIAMGWYLDGRVSALLGTHTHVATADERVLPGGTAYITDVGMTGPHDSVIGVDKDQILERFLTLRPIKFTTAEADTRVAAVLVTVSSTSGRAESIDRIEFRTGISAAEN